MIFYNQEKESKTGINVILLIPQPIIKKATKMELFWYIRQKQKGKSKRIQQNQETKAKVEMLPQKQQTQKDRRETEQKSTHLMYQTRVVIVDQTLDLQ